LGVDQVFKISVEPVELYVKLAFAVPVARALFIQFAQKLVDRTGSIVFADTCQTRELLFQPTKLAHIVLFLPVFHCPTSRHSI
jgi:hypothetical protein